MVNSNSLGLYIHIPFCSSKCAYCDFFSMRGNKRRFSDYTEIVKSRIKFFSEKYGDRTVDTIYFGGGTPSIIGAERIADIIKTVKEYFPVSEVCEITVEANPECVSQGFDFNILKNEGVNRLSIGMQTAVPEELSLLGRNHTNKDVMDTVANAKNSGISNISLDIILGIPNQNEKSLKETIDFCTSLDITHISSYILKIEENTLFWKRKDKYKFPDEDCQANLYLESCRLLEENGFMQYEISNFSKPGFESRHNLKYWNMENYLGIGPAAHSFIDGKRFNYDRSTEKFKNNIWNKDDDCSDIETYIMLKLRLKSGLNFEKLKERFGISVSQSFLKKAKAFQNAGYCNLQDDSVISLTPKGFLLSNSIIVELLETL